MTDLLDLAAEAEDLDPNSDLDLLAPSNGTIEPATPVALDFGGDNPLGLSLDDDNPLDKNSIIVIYGETKVGKTTEMAKVLSHALWVCAEPAILAPFADWYALNEKEARAAGMRDPRLKWAQGGMARKTLPEYQADGKTPFPTYDTINVILHRYVQAVNAGTSPFSGLVLDEYNVLAGRVWNDMLRICVDRGDPRFKTKNKAPDRYGPPREIINWVNWLCSIGRAGGGSKKLGLVCHPVDPDKEDDIKGGPAGPTQKSRRALTKSADAIIRIYKEKVRTTDDEVDALGLGTDDEKERTEAEKSPAFEGEIVDDEGYTRRLQTSASDLWEAGIRSFRSPGRAKLDVRGLLLDAGFRFDA